jgi:hypothetical protein
MFKLKINPDDGEPFEVESTSRDIVKWECSAKNRSVGRLVEDMRMTDITDLAWFAADRRGLTRLDIRAWREQVDIDFERIATADEDEGEDDEPGAGPIRPAR